MVLFRAEVAKETWMSKALVYFDLCALGSVPIYCILD